MRNWISINLKILDVPISLLKNKAEHNLVKEFKSYFMEILQNFNVMGIKTLKIRDINRWLKKKLIKLF